MTITQLKYFIAVAEELNITKVAEQFHVSQPAVSSAIRELEKEFEVTLFERQHKDLFLTVLGNTTYHRAKKLMEHYNEFQSELKESNITKRVSLAIAPNVAAIHLANLFLYMQKEMPGTIINMQENYILNMTQMLKNNSLDAACFACREDSKDPALTYIHIGSFSLSLCAAPNLLSKSNKKITPYDLKDIPMIFSYKSSQLNTSIIELFSQFHIMPNVIFHANQLITILEFVRKGIAVGFLPSELLVNEHDIIQYELEGITYMSDCPIYFVYKKKNPTTIEMLHICRSYFKKLNSIS